MEKVSGIETRKFASEQADKSLGRLAFEIGRVVKYRNADAVHDLRVAVRRFSQTLRVFKPCFRGKEPRKIRRELKRIMVLAGEVRNCDIALKLLAKSKQAERIAVRPKLQSRRREAEHVLVAMLKRWQERKSSRKWRSVLEISATETAQPLVKASVAKTARTLLPRMAEDFFELGARAARTKASPAELHQFRIATKKFRYSLELFTPLYGAASAPLLGNIKQAQGLLGDVNDCETVRAMIAQYKGGDGVMAWLRKRQRKGIAQFQQYWGEAFGPSMETRNWSDLLRHTAAKSLEVKPPIRRAAAAAAPARSRAAVA
jgi:CHAD domain-containing protein